MKHLFNTAAKTSLSAMLLSALLSSPAWADGHASPAKPDAHSGHHNPAAADAAASAAAAASTTTAANTSEGLPWAEAEVRRVDLQANKVALKHGEIKNLDMPPMSMVFRVRDPALLGGIKAGDKVRFQADQINGAYTVLALQPLP